MREYLGEIKQDTVGFEDGVMKMVEIVFNSPAHAAGLPDELLRVKLLAMLVDILRTRSFFNDNSSVEKLANEINAKVGETQWVLCRDPVKKELELLKPERAEAGKILSKSDTWMKNISDAMKEKRNELGKQPALNTLDGRMQREAKEFRYQAHQRHFRLRNEVERLSW